jgi:hypothetical protein
MMCNYFYAVKKEKFSRKWEEDALANPHPN